jgi:hypothetical protein
MRVQLFRKGIVQIIIHVPSDRASLLP